MSSARARSTLSAPPVSPNPLVSDPPLEKPAKAPRVTAERVPLNPAPQNGPRANASPGNASQRPARKRGRTQRGLVRPRCPQHGGEMLVGRTVGSVQYRYCTVAGCNCAVTTFRSDAPHKRWPPASHAGGGAAAEGVTIIPQESPVAPGEWPVGRPVPGQSS